MSCFSCQLGHMRKKFLLCPAFLVSWDICEKSSYYVPYKCHNRTFVASSRPYVPFDFYRRTFLLSFCLYVPCFCHSRTFFSLSCLYVPLSLFTGIFFDLYPLYVPSGSFSRFLCRTEMFRKGKSVYLLVSITKNPGNTQLNVLPPPSSFVFRHHPQSVFLSHPYDNFSS